MASKIVVNLDTSKEVFLNSKCKQNDDLILECNIFENGLTKDLTNCSIVIQALKADKTYIIQNTDITKNKNNFIANLVRDFTRVSGETEIEIVLTESSKQNTTFSFCLEVVGSVIRGAVESKNTVTILENLQDKIEEAGVVKQETEQLIEKGGAATKGDIQEVNAHLDNKVSKRFEGNIDANLKKIKNLQNPILVTNELYPNEKNKYNVCWADNDSIYAIGGDRMLRKSIDGGITWTKQDTTNRSAISGGIFRKLKNGTLLSCTTSSPIKIMRSVDDGATWTQPLTLDSGVSILGSQGWCEDNNGYVYIAEYHTLDRETNIWISKDYGETWAKLKTFSRAEIRHAHACCLDPWSGKVFITVGDALTECGIYSVNDTYDGVIEIVHSDASMSFQESQRYRAVGLMFFENYIAWGMDGGNSPCLYRLKRSNFGNSQAIENMGRISGVAWWTQRANEENTKWVVSVSNENNYDGDNYGHILLVENEGESIYELATFPNTRDGQYVSMQPIGKGGNRFWLTNYRSSPNFQGSYALSNSFSVLPLPIKDIKYIDKTTISSGVITVPQYGTKTFFIASTQAIASNFIIYNLGVRKLSGNGTARIRILNNQTSGNIFDTSSNNLKTQTTKEGDEFLTEIACVGNSSFEFIAVNTGSEPVELNAYVVYGWEV